MKIPESIEEAIRSGNESELQEICNDLHPADAAAAFTSLNEKQQIKFAQFLNNDALSLITSFLPAPESADLIASLEEKDRTVILESLPDDVVTDLIQETDEDKQKTYVELLSEEKKDAAEKLLGYPEDSAGGRMTTAYATLQESMSVKEAIESLEEIKEDAEILARIYVVDENNTILGKVRLRDLTFNAWSTPIKDVMDHEKLAIRAEEDQEEALRMMLRYDMLALPVIDSSNRLLGIITHDDALEIQEEESTEDLEKAAAIAGERDEEGYLKSPVLSHFKRRVVWVFFLAIVAILSGLVILKYENLLENVFILAVYMPMIVATGGNTGSQAATMVIRAMSLGEFTPAEFFRVVWKELRVGLALGALLGVLIAIGSWILITTFISPDSLNSIIGKHGLNDLVITVGIAMIIQVSVSTFLGAALPMMAKSCKLDPAVVASPAITTIVDVLGLLIYFGTASIILGI
ncbi:MAG: magnesium transporter [Verrucomicrobiales bacterium]|nr:magnesium transporter [Verrucomicrobiales bacterium]MEC9036703.1 magnesium transporter [Verrucomicrobiota bacterium]MED5470839.1 magnesium transporter [Verrucomicrobiota bacterium]HAA87436.1 magnesium transporter [Verrucomicrobiales bacterium]|tara:strand:- start:460 stop:1851 length:1392 start_codon:yes stop_codon:yes gene_type:complete